MKTIKAVKARFERKNSNSNTVFFFEIAPEIEKIYSEMNHDTRNSTKWRGLSFYYIPAITNDKNYKNILYRYELIDNFGSSLIADNRFNIAWLRTIGGKGQITIPAAQLNFSRADEYLRNAMKAIKEHFQTLRENYTIQATITVEE